MYNFALGKKIQDEPSGQKENQKLLFFDSDW